MKFKTYLETISGVQIYPMISLLLFIVFFVAVTYWAFKINKNDIEKYENIPLEK